MAETPKPSAAHAGSTPTIAARTRSRKRASDCLTPVVGAQKRRRPTLDEAIPAAKRQRVVDHDVEMRDCQPSAHVRRKKKNKLLRNVLRAEKIERSVLRNIRMQRCADLDAAAKAFEEKTFEAQQSSATTTTKGQMQSSCVESGQKVVEDEDDVCEVIDASQCSDSAADSFQSRNGPHASGGEPSVQAALLTDGRCVVHVVKRDGTTQTIVFDTEADWHQQF